MNQLRCDECGAVTPSPVLIDPNTGEDRYPSGWGEDPGGGIWCPRCLTIPGERR